MRIKKFIALILTVVMAAALLAGCGAASTTTAASENAASEDKPVTLKFAIYLASGSRYETAVVEPFVKAVEERSNGSIKFELYTGATLCAADATLDAVKDGLADIG